MDFKSAKGPVKWKFLLTLGAFCTAESIWAALGTICKLAYRSARSLARRGRRAAIGCARPLAAIDIPNLIRETGDTIESSDKNARVLTFRIRKS